MADYFKEMRRNPKTGKMEPASKPASAAKTSPSVVKKLSQPTGLKAPKGSPEYKAAARRANTAKAAMKRK